MANFTKKIDEALICMAGFLSGAIAATSPAGSLATYLSEPLQVKHLFDHADATSRSLGPATALTKYELEVYE